MPDTSHMPEVYDPLTTRLLTFHDHVPAFLDGTDTPRDYLERCLATIEAREGEVQAFAHLNPEGARAAADAATARYAAGAPLSPIDGMPMGIKDLFDSHDMPTENGSPIFKGRRPAFDSALIAGLRAAGAVILGKTVTTEFAFYNPGPTRSPFDPSRTPGGSSSGSGAAVGARFVPVTIGSQVVGSLIRPSSFNANYGFKPSFGSINLNGAHSNLSQTALGTHAGSLTDAWVTARAAARFAGGDMGHVGLTGPATLPPATPPANLARLDTAGWAKTQPDIRAKFDALLERLGEAGLPISSRAQSPRIDAFERIIEPALDITNDICGYEFLWPLKLYAASPAGISDNIAARLEDWEKITTERYATLLDRRAEMRAAHAALQGDVSAFITLSATGPAPKGLDYTGDPVFAVNSSILGAPAINLPLLEAEGLPLGIQIIGYARRDAELFGIAHWIVTALGHAV
jgi:Asp-tRNA(Asn)/Glu-tRNA(Gln) amidotransferase A subunit family amidase